MELVEGETLAQLIDRGPQTVLLLETLLVLRDEALERMEKHPVENGAFRMARTGDSRHNETKN
jgi:hypothetical protein